jgi:outer membrane protein TolC
MMLLVALLFVSVPADTLTLDAAYRAAEAHHPLREQIDLREDIATLRVQNLNARYLPSFAVGGQATYYSDVVNLPFDMPGVSFPQPDNDQYKVALSVNQLVYDSGMIAAQKALETIQRDLDQQQVEVESYAIRNQVNGAFLSALLLEAQLASLATLHVDIDAKLDLVQAQVRGGVALPGQAEVLAAERIKVEQQQLEARANRRAALDMLGVLMGRTLPDDVVLALPDPEITAPLSDAKQRPEYERFALNRSLLAAQQTLAARKNRPTVSSFAEAAYGRPPALDFFETDFKPFYTIGLRMNWNAWDWHTSRREQEVLALQKDMVDAQEATFAQQLSLATQQHLADIERLQALLQTDEEIIALRQRVVDQAASQLANGVITATDYLTERNAAHQAELTRALHRLQLAQAQVNYLTTIGEE